LRQRRDQIVCCCVLGAALIATSCQASYPTQPTQAVPVALRVHYLTATGVEPVGTGRGFSAYLLNSDGAYENVTDRATWSSSDPTVLQRDAHSFFRAVATGAAEIVARYTGLQSSVWVVVVQPESQAYPHLAIAPGDPHTLGQRAQAVATLRVSSSESLIVTDAATWSSTDTRVITVDRGAVTGVGPGTAQILVSYGGLSTWYGLSIQPSQ
jgi:hypothetical protein